MPFKKIEEFDRPYGDSDAVEIAHESSPIRIRRRRPLKKRIGLWLFNALFQPSAFLVCMTCSATGIRSLLAASQAKLYSLPIMGAGLLRNYDGFDRLDLSQLMAAVLFAAAAYLWYRIFMLLMDPSELTSQRQNNSILFYLHLIIAVIILAGDAFVFYMGVAAEGGGGWKETPGYVPVVVSIMWCALMALIGAIHADHSHSGSV